MNQSIGGAFVESTSQQKATAEIQSAMFAVDQAIIQKDIKMAVIAAEYELLKQQMIVYSKDEKNTGISSKDATKFGDDLDNALKLTEAGLDIGIENTEKSLAIALKRAVKTAFGSGDLVSSLIVGGGQGRLIAQGLKKQIEQFKIDNPEAGVATSKTTSKRFIGKEGGPQLDTGRAPETTTTMGAGTEELRRLEEMLERSTVKSDMFRMSLMTLGETLKGLGPQGELVSAFANGGIAIMNSMSNSKQNIEDMTKAYSDPDSGLTAAQKESAIAGGTTAIRLQAAADVIGSIGGMMAANSKAQMAELDGQIEAEKKRDGKSKESLAKIA